MKRKSKYDKKIFSVATFLTLLPPIYEIKTECTGLQMRL